MARWMTVPEFCHEYHVSRTRAYALLYAPGFPAYRIGPGKKGAVRINADQLDRWISARQLSNPMEMERSGIKTARRSTVLTVHEQILAEQAGRRKRDRRDKKREEA